MSFHSRDIRAVQSSRHDHVVFVFRCLGFIGARWDEGDAVAVDRRLCMS